MKRTVPILLVLILIPIAVFSVDYTLAYIHGTIEVQVGGGWRLAEIGTVFSEDAVLRIGSGSVAELSSGALRITLSEPGTYFVSELIKSSRQVSSWGIVQTVRGKIRNLFRGTQELESTTMGVRADKATDDLGFEWMDEEEEAVDEGKSLLEAERYEEAVAYFEEALELADERSRSLYLFYVGYAYAMAGKNGLAMRYLNEADPSLLGAHYGDYILLKGQLLLEGQAYQAALELFDPFLKRFPDHENVQTVYFLAAFCSSQLGRKADAAQSLQKAYTLDPSSETGRKARAMLDSL
ncbi:MAG: tetratricopeptide repeat protein [Spirochaetaceae bacterium]|nr:MAG: tetratricopeptide repeat protein [Spirochaetaceae bacterium]